MGSFLVHVTMKGDGYTFDRVEEAMESFHCLYGLAMKCISDNPSNVHKSKYKKIFSEFVIEDLFAMGIIKNNNFSMNDLFDIIIRIDIWDEIVRCMGDGYVYISFETGSLSEYEYLIKGIFDYAKAYRMVRVSEEEPPDLSRLLIPCLGKDVDLFKYESLRKGYDSIEDMPKEGRREQCQLEE